MYGQASEPQNHRTGESDWQHASPREMILGPPNLWIIGAIIPGWAHGNTTRYQPATCQISVRSRQPARSADLRYAPARKHTLQQRRAVERGKFLGSRLSKAMAAEPKPSRPSTRHLSLLPLPTRDACANPLLLQPADQAARPPGRLLFVNANTTHRSDHPAARLPGCQARGTISQS